MGQIGFTREYYLSPVRATCFEADPSEEFLLEIETLLAKMFLGYLDAN